MLLRPIHPSQPQPTRALPLRHYAWTTLTLLLAQLQVPIALADDAPAPPDPALAEGAPTEVTPSEPVPDESAPSEATPAETAPAEPEFPEPASTEAGSEAGEPRKKPFAGMRVAVGGRSGYAGPFGDVVSDAALNDTVAFAVPLIFDATARLQNGTELGVYAHLAFGSAGDELGRSCSDCSTFGFQLALQLNQHLNSTGFFDPWIGAALGLEVLNVSESRTVDAITTSGSVVEVTINRSTNMEALPMLGVQAGLDIGGDPLAFGPFVSLSVAQYSSTETKVKCTDFRCSDADLVSSSGDIASDRQSWHGWLTLGVRGSYLLL